MAKRILFIDRDGTIIKEPPVDFQVDSFEKLDFLPNSISNLKKINELNWDFVMVSNQDGLGTPAYPMETFQGPHDLMLRILASEGIAFQAEHIDDSFPEANSPNRKPRTGMLQGYLNNADYDIANSFVIGDRWTDVELAKNLGCKAIFLGSEDALGNDELSHDQAELKPYIALWTTSWDAIYDFLRLGARTATIQRTTKETDIRISMDLDGSGKSDIDTGIAFFDHMLDQVAKHGQIDLQITVIGDLVVDEHHTIEDTALALGECIHVALGQKLGIERYGYCLPMDDCLAQVAIDFGGRNWLEWDAVFKREMIGGMPTEMFFHFFKSFTDSARCNLNIKAEGTNEHHKIEGIFKAFAKALKMAKTRNADQAFLPSTKGVL